MKKEDIYRLIEYNGVYDDKVKKNLKKLIKKYHPDHQGDNKIIKILFEVKKELETKTSSFEKNKSSNNQKIDDSLECVVELKKLYKEKSCVDDSLRKLYQDLSENFREYSDCYRQYCRLQNDFCNNKDEQIHVKKVTKIELLIYLLLLITFAFCLYSNHILFVIIAIVLLCYAVCTNFKRYSSLISVRKKAQEYYDKQKVFDARIKKIRLNINKNSDSINNLRRDVQKISDNIRYYDNLINKKR